MDPKTSKATLPKIKHDGEFAIATGQSRFEKSWKNRSITWSQLVERLSKTTRTAETFADYQKSTKAQRDSIKDVGGFVGGSIKHGLRKTGNIANRTLLTLDMDEIQTKADAVWDTLTLLYGHAAVVYSTHSHTPDRPRLRLVMPFARPVMPDEYQAIGRMIANDIGIDQFDDTTYEPHRLMYWPSTSQDAEFYFRVQDGPWLNPDEVLARYPDWRDVSFWPESSRQKARIIGQMKKQEDPLGKEGVVGAFCRAYTISEVIEKHLSEIYELTHHEGRYTFAPGTSVGGVVTYEDKWSYSHHATDPASGQLCNAFDLLRIHRFGELDDDAKHNTPANRLPSYVAMCEFAAKDPKVKELINKERLQQVMKEFEFITEPAEDMDMSWMAKLEMNRKGDVVSTINNVLIILENDPNIKDRFGYNEFSNKIEIFDALPWSNKAPREWDDTDDAGVRHYVESAYGISGASKIADAVTLCFNRHRFHPVKEYLASLRWDGVPRIDTLLIDYMGAEDSEYVRFVTRKWMCGAVARILHPGIKFDYMLVLTGEQGIYKSTFFSFLAKDWFTDSLQDVEGNQAIEKLMGSWIVEFGELQAFSRSESSAIKRFITSQEDRTRLAYDRRVSYLPRQCVFAGTTNKLDFLKDDTGNRRYWPVEVKWEGRTKDVIKDLPKELDQIWAEAVVMWKEKKETLYPSREQEALANKYREAHREINEKEGLIIDYLDKLLPEDWDDMDLIQRRTYLQDMDSARTGTKVRTHVCILEIWCECLGKNQADLRRQDSLELARIMNNITNWRPAEIRKYMSFYGRQRVYERINLDRPSGTDGTDF